MLQPDMSATGRTGTQWNAAQPATRGMGGGAFAAVFQQVHNEVKQVIENGWPSDAVPTLNLEGQMRRANLPATAAAALSGSGALDDSQQEFLAAIAPWAKEAGQKLGVSGDIVAAHAALESGWGQRPLRDGAGQDSHNLFGIKANSGWGGTRVDALTTEFEGASAVKKTEGFRSYPDFASAFRDYTQLLQDSPRYRGALHSGNDAAAFAQALARGGYATDPDYATKLTRLANRIQSSD